MEDKQLTFHYHDGGRKDAGYKGTAGDCFVRAVAIVMERPYKEIYDEVNMLSKREKITKRKKSKSSARDGVYKATAKRYLFQHGFKWIPTMFIGSGCKVHLRADELPMGRLIVTVSKHYCAVIDGVIRDTHNPSRGGKRCVYGYYIKK